MKFTSSTAENQAQSNHNQDIEHVNRKQVYQEMMQVRALSVDQVNEQANLYFKSVDKGLPDWDKFDNLLLQIAMLAMNEVKIESVIDRHKDINVHF